MRLIDFLTRKYFEETLLHCSEYNIMNVSPPPKMRGTAPFVSIHA